MGERASRRLAGSAASILALSMLASGSGALGGEAETGAVPGAWVTVKTTHFSFMFHPKASSRVQPVIDESEEDLQRLRQVLGAQRVDSIEVRVARDTEEMKEVKPGSAPFPWATGIAMRGSRMILLSLTPPGGGDIVGLRELFLHEVVHILTYDATQRIDLPVWFTEGLAIHLSGEFSFARHKTLIGAAMRNELLPISKLDQHYPDRGREITIAYAQSADLVHFIIDRYDESGELIPGLFRNLARGDAFDAALASLCKRSVRQIEGEWLQSLNVYYKWAPSLMGGGVLWGLMTALLFLAYIRRMRKARATLRRMELEEEFFNLMKKDFIVDEKDTGKSPKKTEDMKMVYHDGQYHTLH